MARRVYFAFDYQDVFVVNHIRRSGQFVGIAVAGFADASMWEKLKRRDDAKIKQAIDATLAGTSVTVCYIGPRTATRRYVRYELAASRARNKGLLGIYLPGMRGHPIPATLTAARAPVYQWNPSRFPAWIELAAQRVGR